MTSVIIIMIIFLIQLFKCELTLPASEASSQCESTLNKQNQNFVPLSAFKQAATADAGCWFNSPSGW